MNLKYRSIALLLLIVAITVFAASVAAEMPAIEGWTIFGEVGTYDQQTLWEFINGAAEQFINYGFQELQVCDYTADGLVFTVNIYTMDTPLNTFGIYNAQKPRKAEPLAIGAEGVVAMPYQCLLYKNHYYVMVDLYEGEMTTESGTEFLERLAAALPGGNETPAELNFLPENNRVAETMSYTPESFLGLGDLKRCLHAEYTLDNKTRVTGFLVLPKPNKPIKDVWDKLAAKWKTVTHKKSTILIKKIPYRGPVGLIRTDKAIMGISGITEESALIKALAKWTE